MPRHLGLLLPLLTRPSRKWTLAFIALLSRLLYLPPMTDRPAPKISFVSLGFV